jgi:tetratricopeptide (TPR) repeat protein
VITHDVNIRNDFPTTHRSSKRFVVYLVILLAFSLVVIQFPLLNYLGYEFSAAVSLVLPWIIGGYAFKTLRDHVPDRSSLDAECFYRVIRDVTVHIGMLLGIPLIVATLNMFVVKNCAYGEGILYYLLLPGITALWLIALAVFCWVMFRRALLIYYCITAGILLHPLFLGYFSPQIYSYNFVYGFFPGFSYDEALSISQTLLIFRCVTALSALLFFLLSITTVKMQIIGRTWIAKLVTLYDLRGISLHRAAIMVLSIGLLVVWMVRVPIGFETSTQYIQSTLGAKYVTEHFDIYYASDKFSDEDIAWVGAQHEFYLYEIDSVLQLNSSGRIVSYIYPDGETQQRMIGTSSTNIAKPWRREIHLSADGWQTTLKHELVHVVAGEFGMPVIKAHYNIGLVEGLATAVDGDFGNRTLNEYAAAIKKFELVKNPGRLIQPLGFAVKASTVSYVLMGSFCSYLIDRYGIVRFKELYGGRSPETVYNKPYETLIGEWQQFLDRIVVPELWRKHVMYYFNRPSIFAKECPRVVAVLNEGGYRAMIKSDGASAMRLFSDALKKSWNTESYAGLVRASYDAGRYDTVIRLVDARLSDSLGRSGVINLLVLYGDALWQKGNIDSARKAYEEVLALDLSDRYDESIALRLVAIADTNLQKQLPSFFTGALTDSAAQVLLFDIHEKVQNPVVGYLEARLHLKQKHYNEAIHELEQLQSPFDFPILNAGREQIIGQAYFRMKNYQQARTHFWQSLNYITNETSRRRVEQWLARCEWYERYSHRIKG